MELLMRAMVLVEFDHFLGGTGDRLHLGRLKALANQRKSGIRSQVELWPVWRTSKRGMISWVKLG